MNSELNNLENENNEINQDLEGSILDLQEETSSSVLNTIYKKEGVLLKVVSILNGYKINPSDLTDELNKGREEFREIESSNDDDFDENNVLDNAV